VLVTGVALMLVQPSLRPTLLSLHKASFVVWFGACLASPAPEVGR
jgi:hypothetical protein